jgi:membrane fusion protein, multidrug efflux system
VIRNYLALCALSFVVAAGCSDNPKDEARAGTTRPPAGAQVAQDPARGGAPGGAPAGGPAGGRAGMSVTLAATDVATVVKRPLERGVSITGELRPIERIDIRARLEGDLISVNVREGQRVARGALLAQFESFVEQSGRASAEADRAAARTEVAHAQLDLQQSRELFKEGAIPERDVRVDEQTLASARARLAAAEQRVRSAANAVSDTRVTAPVSGVIETRTVSPGEHVARGAPMFTLVRNDVLELAAAVPAQQASDLRIGQTIRFSAANRSVIGRVARISPTVDPASRAVTVYVQVPNAGGELRGGTFASGRLVLSAEEAVISIPANAVRFRADTGEPFVYRIVNGTIEQATVSTGYADESAGVVEVVAGLNEGDRIVIGNVGTLGRGMKVQIVGGERRGR